MAYAAGVTISMAVKKTREEIYRVRPKAGKKSGPQAEGSLNFGWTVHQSHVRHTTDVTAVVKY